MEKVLEAYEVLHFAAETKLREWPYCWVAVKG